jgi:hypothetical protein
MGDRCWIQVTVRTQDVAVAANILDPSDDAESHDDGTTTLLDGEADYGWSTELQDLAERKHIPFVGCHGAGDEYGAQEFCSDGQTYHEIPEGPMVLALIHDDGAVEIDEDSLGEIKEYAATLTRARKLLYDAEPVTEKEAAS